MAEFSATRYDTMTYRRCGQSGLMLPAISLGCWHSFGDHDDPDIARAMLRRAFDLGITHFDLANNYGPPPGSAERNVGRILQEDFQNHRDELIISSKAGHLMWPGPYGEWSSRKSILASCDQSLQRLGLDYVDIFYSHRFDADTPVAETVGALDTLVKSGKALYVGISKYPPGDTVEAIRMARQLNTPLIIHQPPYSMLNRAIEQELTRHTVRLGMGIIAFCPLAQGILTEKYLDGIPEDSRARNPDGFLQESAITEDTISRVRQLNDLAKQRGQTMAQMALAWVLRDDAVTSALMGASKVKHIEDNVAALNNLCFTDEELNQIDCILNDA